MKFLSTLLLIFLFSSKALFCQVQGIVVDKKTLKPIPYVNMQVLGKPKGFTSNFKGRFKLTINPNEKLVLSAIGYENITLGEKEISDTIFLKPIAYALPEVLVSNLKEEKKTKRIGKVGFQLPMFTYGFGGYSVFMIARYFPFQASYEETPFIQTIGFYTNSKIDKAIFNVRLHKMENDSLGEVIYPKNLFVSARKGLHKTSLALDDYAIPFPKEGLFIVVEPLIIEENKYLRNFKDSETKEREEFIQIAPSFIGDTKTIDLNSWVFIGRWTKAVEIFEFYKTPVQMEVVLTNQ